MERKDTYFDEDETTELLDLNFARVLEEERTSIQESRSRRVGHGQGRPRFAVAFSGGGIRAAAFQSGVLWRLAEKGVLKDVDYFAAVSGGAYIAAAFTSDVAGAQPPKDAGHVDSWYLGVVARTLSRMQQNAGGFIRDPEAGATSDDHDAKRRDVGLLPRIFDAPMLAVVVLVTLIVNPIELLFVYLVPITEGMQLFFGAALRKAYCMNGHQGAWQVLMEWSPLPDVLASLNYAVVLAFALWVISNLPIFQLKKSSDGGVSKHANAYLIIHGAMAFLTRYAIALLLLILLLLSVPAVQNFSYGPDTLAMQGNATVETFCRRYALLRGHSISNGKLGTADMGCSNFYNGKVWYEDDRSMVLLDPEAHISVSPELQEAFTSDAVMSAASAVPQDVRNEGRPLTSWLLGIFGTLLVFAAILVPFFPDLFLAIVTHSGPAVTFALVVLFVQYQTYGPLTGQPLFFSYLPFDRELWESFIRVSLLAGFVLAFFFNDFRRIWHWFYVRSLRLNFFEASKDWTFRDINEHPYCPFLVLTGTISDYKQPGDEDHTSEISFSALHAGGESTGYVRAPEYQKLATCTALSAAGCLDAISLSLANHLKFRFWLEMLNFSWGDFVLFTRRGSAVAQRCKAWFGARFEQEATWVVYRAPTCAIWFVGVLVLWWGLKIARSTDDEDCQEAKAIVLDAFFLALGMFALSFFAFLPCLGWLMFSPLVRQVHQATRHCFEGSKPPGMLYVTDGGVRDCTGIVQLMRRHCECILLVLAAADPCDELGVLRKAMDAAVEDRIGSFFDPDDPKRDVRIMLEEFQKDKSRSHLRIGIRYGWDSAKAGLGELYVVKIRLPPSLAGLAVRPLLTEEEVRGEKVSTDFGPYKEAWEMIRAAELGGLGCCDCCHRNGCNCGTKFPHLTGANYLWLTPMLFSSLARLGFEVSAEAIDAVSRR